MRRLLIASVLVLVLAPACKSKDNTKIVVGVWSDLGTPVEMDGVRIDVTGPTDVGSKTFDLVAGGQEGKSALPILLDLVPLGPKDATFTVTAYALKGGGPLFAQTARVTFSPGEARLLKMFLGRACQGNTCTGDSTCSAGVCGAVAQPSLPTYDPNVPLVAAVEGGTRDSGVEADSGVADTGGGGSPTSDAILVDARTPDVGSTILDAPLATGGSGGASGAGGGGGTTVATGGITVSSSAVAGGAGAGGIVASSTARTTGGSSSTKGGTSASTVTGGGIGGRTGGTTILGGTSANAGSGGGGATGTIPPNTTGPGGILLPPRKFFGNIDTRSAVRTDFKSMWDQFTPENAGKWGSVQGSTQSTFNWNSLDAMYEYCEENGILFKEYTFCWGAGQPSWLNSTNAETAVKAWMKTFCKRYPNTAMIDVVNESLHNSPSYKEGMGGAGASGYDWIVNAFTWAREACPKAILLYNDYNTIEYASENNAVIKLVNAVKGAGAPIDGVGCQAHDVGSVAAATVKSYVEKIIAETGLPVYITQMDIGKADDAQQLKIMQDVVAPLWDNEMVKGWTYWGYLQGATWRSNTHLLMSDGTQRPALSWLMTFLNR